jgi:amino acid adenylation domain-containing protein
VAVVSAGEELTYGELDERIERLARRLSHHLRCSDAGPEAIIGVCLEPSPDLVAALFAVWRAGGVFLPLDPAYPAERLSFMLEDSGALLMLTRRGLLDLPVPGVREILLDEPDLEREIEAEVRPEDLAYVIYTSGSTGRPKGVAVQHGAAADHMEAAAAAFGLCGGDRMLQFASPSFDVWLEETVPALISGAALVLRGTELWEPAQLLARIRALGLTVVGLPTAYWQQWVREYGTEEMPEGVPASLRLVVVGGEAMPAEAARLWWRSPLRRVRLLNGYGPTEAVISATFGAVEAPLAMAVSVPLGQPLSGRSLRVLDRRGHLLPAGVPGEIFLGGAWRDAGLARGY